MAHNQERQITLVERGHQWIDAWIDRLITLKNLRELTDVEDALLTLARAARGTTQERQIVVVEALADCTKSLRALARDARACPPESCEEISAMATKLADLTIGLSEGVAGLYSDEPQQTAGRH